MKHNKNTRRKTHILLRFGTEFSLSIYQVFQV